MKVLVLGGDGYCGRPTSLHLSDVGHELSAASLTPISDMKERINKAPAQPSRITRPA